MYAESQGEICAKKNIYISIIKLKEYGLQTDYSFNSIFSIGLGAEVSSYYQNQVISGTTLNSIYYENEIRDFKRVSLYFSTNYYPVQSLDSILLGDWDIQKEFL